MRWTEDRHQELRERWSSGEKSRSICSAMGITRNSIRGRSRILNLPPRGEGRTLAASHPAVSNHRTLFPGSVREPSSTETVLRPAWQYQKKLGARVLKGRWRGMPIYSLTLEERATCPHDCPMLRACYGNNMHMATRFRAGPDLGEAVQREAAILSNRHKKGFVVRLHILGDFYSESYVALWSMLLTLYPQLNIFGYSAWRPETKIGAALEAVRAEFPDRFCVRISGSRGSNGAIVVDEFSTENDVIPCPVETGNSQSCGACALCWTADKAIAFKRH